MGGVYSMASMFMPQFSFPSFFSFFFFFFFADVPLVVLIGLDFVVFVDG